MATDGSGGAFLVWEDYRFDDPAPDIFATRLLADGTLPWRQSGEALRIDPLVNANPGVVADGEGGAIFIWYEGEYSAGSAPGDLYAQRVDGNGNALWRVLAASRASRGPFAVASDSFGGVVLVWIAYGSGNVHGQRVGANGTLLWRGTGHVLERSDSLDTAGGLPSAPAAPVVAPIVRLGIPVCTVPAHRENVMLAADGRGGAFVAWTAWYKKGAYMQHVGSTGAVSWAEGGILVEGSSVADAIVPDGSAGGFLAFGPGTQIGRFNAYGLFYWVRRVGSLGAVSMVPDGAGGVIVAWDGSTSSFHSYSSDIKAQRVNSTGEVQWPGNSLCSAEGPQEYPQLVADGEGGAYVAWWDGRASLDPYYTDRDIYAQHVSPDGVRSWTTDGIAVCTAPHDQSGVQLALSSFGGVLLAWRDERNFSTDIYAQHVERDGSLGPRVQGFNQSQMVRVLYGGPIRPVVDVLYALPSASNVVLRVYDVRGRRAFERDLGMKQAGQHLTPLDIRDLARGQYLLSIQAEHLQASRKLIVYR